MVDLINKSKILIFILNYLPGYKSGGVLRTIVNTVDWLSNNYEFWIVTRDRDLGSEKPYSDIKIDEWQLVEGAMVRYLPPELINTNYLIKLINETPHDLIHLNSFFDKEFTIRIMLARKMGWLSKSAFLLSPRGEFGEGSLKLKYAKKLIFIYFAKVVGLYDNIAIHATSEYELHDIKKVLNLTCSSIRIAIDLPSKIISTEPRSSLLSERYLRIVFLSRISREKNLDFALRVLSKTNVQVVFDIYGPDEDILYWKECTNLIKQLPRNITAIYHGAVSPTKVLNTISNYDLFFLPSKGENYGHVIAESISVGTKVLISKNTPWLNLEKDGLGWDIDLKDESIFVNLIEEMACDSLAGRLRKRDLVKKNALSRLLNPSVVNANLALFRV